MSLARINAEDRRLVILRFLAEDADYRLNSSILNNAIEVYGHSVSRDQLHTDLAWLEEQGLVVTETISSVVIAELTSRGLDVAMGKAKQPGVKKPGPRHG